MRLIKKLLALLKLAHEEEQKLYTRLDENERSSTSKLEQWSAKDIMAHIASWKEYMVSNIMATLRISVPLPLN